MRSARVSRLAVSRPEFGSVTAKQALSRAIHRRRQEALLLLRRAELHDRHQAENVEVDRARAGEARAGLRHRLHHQRRFGEAKPRAADAFRHRHAQPAAVGDVGDELFREFAALVGLQPVMVIVLGADLFDRVLDRGLLFGEVEGERHGGLKSSRATAPPIRAESRRRTHTP